MFQEMEIPYISANGNPVKLLIFQEKKLFHISENQNPEKNFTFQETELYYIPENGNPKKTSCISGGNFMSSKNEKRPLVKISLYFRKWNLHAPSLKDFLYFKRSFQSLKIKQKSLLKVISFDVFSIFATVKHRDIPCEANVM